MFLERMTRKERQAVLFAKHESYVPELMRATIRMFEDDDEIPWDDSNFLQLMYNIAVTEPGRKALAEQNAVSLLKSIACGKVRKSNISNHNRLRAAMVLDAMNEDLDEVFTDNFVKMTRGHWADWAYALIEMPPHYSARFVQTAEDVKELFEIILEKTSSKSPGGSLHVIINTLSYLFSLPSSQKAATISQINLIGQHELIPVVVQHLLKQFLDPDKYISNLKLVCYAALSIASNSVRAHVVEEGL